MPAPLRIAAAAALLAAAACVETETSQPPPVGEFVYPTGLAVQALSTGGTALLVVSTNFDLRYDPETGGVLQSVDPATGAARGAVRMGSMGGVVTVVDPATCPGAAGPQALVASRYVRALYRADLDGSTGALVCGPACEVPLEANVDDPFTVEVVCRGDRRHAYVTYLGALAGRGVLGRIDLDTGTQDTYANMAAIPYGLAYDLERDRLWMTEHTVGIGWVTALELSIPCTASETDCPRRTTYDLWPYLRGAEPTGIALSSPESGTPRRLYVATRVYDPDLATSLGGRPSYDVGAALLVFDVAEGPSGSPVGPLPLVRMIPLGLGPAQVRILPPRSGQRDLVAVTSTTEGLLTIYDDDLGVIVKVFAMAGPPGPDNPVPAPLGSPLVGDQPFGLAVEARAGRDWLYVAGFRSNTVTAVSLDPATPGDARIEWMRTGVTP